VVVWAPGYSADELAIVLFALQELHAPVYAAGIEGALPPGVHACGVDQAEPILRSACAVLDVRTDGPAAALALVEFGVPLATTRASGAHEFLDGVVLYEPWQRDSVASAALEAMGNRPPVLRPAAPLPAPAPRPVVVRERAPLVSVLVATYNRPKLLGYTLESLARQTYTNLEIVVVNDGGSPIRDVAEPYGARVIERESNGGHAVALNVALEHAEGSYLGFVDDDDLVFPDHVEVLVEALERSGGFVAHTNSLMMLHGPGDSITGFSPGVTAAVDLDSALVACPLLGMQSMMVRREAFDRVGNFDEAITPNHDYEMMVRLVLQYDAIHVDSMTCLYRHTGTSENMSVRTASRYVELYEEAYKRTPFPDRPVLAAQRRTMVEMIRKAGGIKLATVASRLRRPVPIDDFLTISPSNSKV
jgi:glycosyltransferase involved in cell wall biosynthesis